MRAMKPRNFLKLANPRIRGRNSKSFSLNNFRISNIGMISFFNLLRPEKQNLQQNMNFLTKFYVFLTYYINKTVANDSQTAVLIKILFHLRKGGAFLSSMISTSSAISSKNLGATTPLAVTSSSSCISKAVDLKNLQ